MTNLKLRVRPRGPNRLRVFWYRGGWCWTCWHNRRSVPHTAGYGFDTPGGAADAARRHYRIHYAELRP